MGVMRGTNLASHGRAPAFGHVRLAATGCDLRLPLIGWGRTVRRFHFGPLEFLWLALTYGRADPSRVKHAHRRRQFDLGMAGYIYNTKNTKKPGFVILVLCLFFSGLRPPCRNRRPTPDPSSAMVERALARRRNLQDLPRLDLVGIGQLILVRFKDEVVTVRVAQMFLGDLAECIA